MADADAAVVEALVAGDAVVRDLQLDRVAVGDDAAASVRAADGETSICSASTGAALPDPVTNGPLAMRAALAVSGRCN